MPDITTYRIVLYNPNHASEVLNCVRQHNGHIINLEPDTLDACMRTNVAHVLREHFYHSA